MRLVTCPNNNFRIGYFHSFYFNFFYANPLVQNVKLKFDRSNIKSSPPQSREGERVILVEYLPVLGQGAGRSWYPVAPAISSSSVLGDPKPAPWQWRQAKFNPIWDRATVPSSLNCSIWVGSIAIRDR